MGPDSVLVMLMVREPNLLSQSRLQPVTIYRSLVAGSGSAVADCECGRRMRSRCRFPPRRWPVRAFPDNSAPLWPTGVPAHHVPTSSVFFPSLAYVLRTSLGFALPARISPFSDPDTLKTPKRHIVRLVWFFRFSNKPYRARFRVFSPSLEFSSFLSVFFFLRNGL